MGRQRDVLDAVRALDRRRFEAVRDPELETRIAQYELAFRMQMQAPETLDLRVAVDDLRQATDGPTGRVR